MNSVKSVKPYGNIWDQAGASAICGAIFKAILVPIERDLKQTVSKAIIGKYYLPLSLGFPFPTQQNQKEHVQHNIFCQLIQTLWISTIQPHIQTWLNIKSITIFTINCADILWVLLWWWLIQEFHTRSAGGLWIKANPSSAKIQPTQAWSGKLLNRCEQRLYE